MKNSLKYLKLWQKKRSELRIDDDPQSDWLGMNSILDEQMPPGGGEDGGPSRSKGFKLLSFLLISLSAAAITLVVKNKIEIKNHDHKKQNYKVRKHIALNADGSYRDSVSDSLTANGIALNKKDSLLLNEQLPPLKERTAANSTSVGEPDSTMSRANAAGGSSTQIKNNQIQSPNGQNRNTEIADNNSKSQSRLAYAAGGASALVSRGVPPAGKPGNSGKSNPSLKTHTGNYKDEAHPYNSSNNRSNLSLETSGIQNQHVDILVSAPKIIFGSASNNLNGPGTATLTVKPIQNPSTGKSSNNKTSNGKEKSTKTKGSSSSNLNVDWGLLTGVNTSGSFTAKSQNSNFYGSSPVDLFFGLYATYNIGDKWGINSQVRLFSPQTVTTAYTHPNQSKIDSSQSLQITSSRKIYSINIPLHAVYKVNNNLSLMAGPVINIPVKQINTNTTFQPTAIKSDSVYYPKLLDTLNRTKYEQKVNFGLSVGVNIQLKRFSIGATYMKSLSGYQVSSDFGNFKSYNGTFQFTIGFQLNKLKP